MTDPIRTLIVDDEPLGRQRIATLLEAEDDVAVVGTCANGQAAVAAIERLRPDLVFLDVQMPVMNGFEVLEAVETRPLPVVIFVTAYDQYAVRAFDVHALDYLLKPYDRTRFRAALRRARSHLRREQPLDRFSQQLQALLADHRDAHRKATRENASPSPRRLAVRSGGQIVFLTMQEVDWIEAAGNYLALHVGNKTHLLRETMTAMESRLDPTSFLRIHRSTIVNLDRVQALEPLDGGTYRFILHDGTRLMSSRGYRDAVQALLDS